MAHPHSQRRDEQRLSQKARTEQCPLFRIRYAERLVTIRMLGKSTRLLMRAVSA
jgi:hypothetical protein